jgi:tetratricopeptide (TPR) repeat protein
MSYLDDLPKRHINHDVAETAETVFNSAIASHRLFVIQQKDRSDYGTDVQIEARDGDRMTNIRTHVQLKGTESVANADGSVSVEVDRANLNYLLAQPDSMFACYHVPTRRLLVRFVHDVYSEYENGKKDWSQQKTITVRFDRLFDGDFQKQLSAKIIASRRSARDLRLKWIMTPPDRISAVVRTVAPLIEVPADPEEARVILVDLYESGQDSIISSSFLRFQAVLENVPGAMNCAYMAEINLGINGVLVDVDRIRRGIEVFENEVHTKDLNSGALLYCRANGWSALKEYGKAIELYKEALIVLNDPSESAVAAQCCKNMGTALESLGQVDEARNYYEQAVELDSHLGEVHFSLGLWHLRHREDFATALSHFEQVSRKKGSALQMTAVQGWKVEILFRAEESESAFREIHSLLNEADKADWIWPWCAKQIARYGRMDIKSLKASLVFWDRYLSEYLDHVSAEWERLLCIVQLRDAGEDIGCDFDSFKAAVGRFAEKGDVEAAFLWDRLGHWAQDDNNWIEAEISFRKAYELDPNLYGYCLGVALNTLGKFEDALPILLAQAEEHKPDPLSWFHAAIAHEGVGDIEGGVSAYRKAIELDENYDLAWFNLGGIYWNSGDSENAFLTWGNAIKRFPDHPLAMEVLILLSGIGEI